MLENLSLRVGIDSEFSEGWGAISVQAVHEEGQEILVLNSLIKEYPETITRIDKYLLSHPNLNINYIDFSTFPDIRELTGVMGRNVLCFYSPKDIEYLLGTNLIKKCYKHMQQRRRITVNSKALVKEGGIDIGFTLQDLKGWASGTLEELAKSVNVKMLNKHDLDDYKTHMHDALINEPEKFIEYAMDDAKALLEIDTKFREFIVKIADEQLGIKVEKEGLPLTVGSLISKVFNQWLDKRVLVNKDTERAFYSLARLNQNHPRHKEQLNWYHNMLSGGVSTKYDPCIKAKRAVTWGDLSFAFTPYGEAGIDNFARSRDTTAYNALVLGGRCVNEVPTEYKAALIADIDLSGCYGMGLMSFEYPIGVPKQYGLTSNQKKMPLGTWLKKYEKELIPGLFQIIISTDEDLSFRQDLIFSKITTINQVNKAVGYWDDNEDIFVEDELKHVPGEFVLMQKEISTGVLTAKSLEAIRKVASNQELKEFMSKVMVESACYYPASERCSDVKEWSETIYKSDGNYEWSHKAQGVVDNRSRGFFTIPLSDFIGPLIERRKETKLGKKLGDKQLGAEDTMLKLFINTLYGVFASPFFPISNAVIANNITDKARLGAWMMAKALGSRQSITDGGFYTPGYVYTFNTKKPGLDALSTFSGRLRKTTMGGVEWADKFKEFEGMEPKDVGDYLDKMAGEHIKNFWEPYGLELGFKIEHKGEHTGYKAAYWAKAHYCIKTVWGRVIEKIRGARHHSEGSNLIENPIYELLGNILAGCDKFPKNLDYDFFEILKIGKYNQAQTISDPTVGSVFDLIKKLEILPGDHIVTKRHKRYNNTHMPIMNKKEYRKRHNRKTVNKGEPVEWFEKYRDKGIQVVHQKMVQDKL